ncbi:hypothetical protein G9A89_009674 [Geosiphon pyriformis]|nr:hypothetical protein G9A89_009674 [Geosiphon pyriformis]
MLTGTPIFSQPPRPTRQYVFFAAILIPHNSSRTPPNHWDSLQYHKAWKEAGLPINKGMITQVFRMQLEWIKSNGSKKEKKTATKNLKKFEGVLFIGFPKVNSGSRAGTLGDYGSTRRSASLAVLSICLSDCRYLVFDDLGVLETLDIEENDHLTVATETSGQMNRYLMSSTVRVTKDEVSELNLELNEQEETIEQEEETIEEDTINDDAKEITQWDLDEFTDTFLKMTVSKNLCHSFIVDPDDKNLVKEKIFTEAEVSEIRGYKINSMPEMPRELLTYLNSFRPSAISDLRKSVRQPREWDSPYNRHTHFDHDWIRHTVYSLVREYVANNLQKDHFELWFLVHVWSFIDRGFEGIDGVEAVRRGSRAVWLLQQERIVNELFPPLPRSKGRLWEDVETLLSANFLLSMDVQKPERGKKTPKMMKDIFSHLCALVKMKEEKIRKLETIGFIHSGLTTVLLRLDSPAGFVSRISRTKSLSIPSDVAEFGSKMLPVILMAWKAKMIVTNVIRLVEQDEVDSKDEEEQLRLLQGSCESSPPARMYFPSNMDTPQKKPRLF